MSKPENPVPDPNGPPVPSPMLKYGVSTLGVGTAVAIGGAVVLAIAAVDVTETRGALRSHHVQWEQRQAEIAKSMQQGSASCDAGASTSHLPSPDEEAGHE